MKFAIKQARKHAGLTQAQAAEALGVCRHRYMKIEKDPGEATVAELHKLSKATGIPMEDLSLPSDSTSGLYEVPKEVLDKFAPISEKESCIHILQGLISYHERMTMGYYPERDFYLSALKYAIESVKMRPD